MLQYKANLEVLHQRYTDIERQLLKAFVRKRQVLRTAFPALGSQGMNPPTGSGQMRIHADMWWTLTNLLDDGLIEFREEDRKEMRLQEEQRNAKVVLLTEKGNEFLTHWIAAEPL